MKCCTGLIHHTPISTGCDESDPYSISNPLAGLINTLQCVIASPVFPNVSLLARLAGLGVAVSSSEVVARVRVRRVSAPHALLQPAIVLLHLATAVVGTRFALVSFANHPYHSWV